MSDNSSNNKRIAKNTAFLYLRMILVLFVSLYTTRVVLNVLGIEDYGIYNVVAGFVSLFTFLNSTMTVGIQRFYNYEKNSDSIYSQKDVYNTALTVQLIIALVILTLLETVGIWYINNVMVVPPDRFTATMWVFQCSTISLLFLILQVPFSAAIMASERMDYYAAISVLDVLLKLAVVLLLPFVNFDRLIFYGFLSLAISCLDFLCYFLYCHIKLPEIRFDRRKSTVLLKPMLTFSGWNVLDMSAYTIKAQGLNMLLNVFFGPVINAARGIASQIMGAVQGFSSNVVTAFRPQLVGAYAEGDFNRTTNLMFSMSKISYIFLYILCLPIVLELHQILNLWLNGAVPDYTYVFTILVLADMLISSLNTPLSQVVQATGKLKWYQILRSILVFSIIPISWLALKLGAGACSVFWVSLFVVILNQPVSMYLLHNIYDYSYCTYFKKVLLPIVLFSIAAPLAPCMGVIFMDESIIRLFLIAFTSIVNSVLMLYLTALDNQERMILRTWISNKINCI